MTSGIVVAVLIVIILAVLAWVVWSILRGRRSISEAAPPKQREYREALPTQPKPKGPSFGRSNDETPRRERSTGGMIPDSDTSDDDDEYAAPLEPPPSPSPAPEAPPMPPVAETEALDNEDDILGDISIDDLQQEEITEEPEPQPAKEKKVEKQSDSLAFTKEEIEELAPPAPAPERSKPIPDNDVITFNDPDVTFRSDGSGDIGSSPSSHFNKPSKPLLNGVEIEEVAAQIVGLIQGQHADWDGSETALQHLVEQKARQVALGRTNRSVNDAVFEAVKRRMSNIRTAEFTAYSPREAVPDKLHGLYVYAQAAQDEVREQVQQDVQRYEAELGGEVPKPRNAKQTADLSVGTKITVVPECDEIEFEPPSLTKRWRGLYTRFGFDFYPETDLLDETVFVWVSIQVEGIEIAHIKTAIDIVEAAEKPEAEPTDPIITPNTLTENPLLAHKLQAQSVTPYQHIFISYSRKDTDVARRYKIAQIALGNDVFLDVDNLRSGEDWRAGLARAIDEADVFQLFWSPHSAASVYCQYEWEYALAQRCADEACEGFIRPVYWQKPMPSVPDELRRVNFKFVPFEEPQADA